MNPKQSEIQKAKESAANYRLLAYILSATICAAIGWKLTGSTQLVPAVIGLIHATLFFTRLKD